MKNLNSIFSKNGIELSDKQLDMFTTYYNMLIDWNKKFNLTAITEEDDVIIKHFLDSALGYKYLPQEGNVIDIGSGAGFPGIPLRIMNDSPKIDFMLLDSLDKRIGFLNEVIKELKLNNITAKHARAEEESKVNRGKYDLVFVRAVASMPTLLEYSLPLLKIGGKLLAYKGDAQNEIESSKKALDILGGKIESIEEYKLNGEYNRAFVIVKKIKETSIKYPRPQNKPKLNPIL